jgi:hypothetical protein
VPLLRLCGRRTAPGGVILRAPDARVRGAPSFQAASASTPTPASLMNPDPTTRSWRRTCPLAGWAY